MADAERSQVSKAPRYTLGTGQQQRQRTLAEATAAVKPKHAVEHQLRLEPVDLVRARRGPPGKGNLGNISRNLFNARERCANLRNRQSPENIRRYADKGVFLKDFQQFGPSDAAPLSRLAQRIQQGANQGKTGVL